MEAREEVVAVDLLELKLVEILGGDREWKAVEGGGETTVEAMGISKH